MKSDTTLSGACSSLPDSGRVYTHLAHALARGYTDLFYVNMESDEYIEFHTDDERGVLNEARRSADFLRAASGTRSSSSTMTTRRPLSGPWTGLFSRRPWPGTRYSS